MNHTLTIDVKGTTDRICLLAVTDGKGRRYYWRDARNASTEDMGFDVNDPTLNGWKLYATFGPKPRATFAGWLKRLLRWRMTG